MIKIAKNKDKSMLIICGSNTDEGQTFGYEFQQDNDKTALKSMPLVNYVLMPRATFSTAALMPIANLSFQFN